MAEAKPESRPEVPRAETPRAEAPPAGSPRAEAPPAGSPRAESLFERIDEKLAEKVVIDRNIMPTSREQYRRLAAVLHDAQGSSGLRVVMVGSAVAGEGKTLTASNLALTFSESYRKRVLLIDADLRKPALHGVFRINSTSGLTDGFASENAQLTVRQVSDRLSILPAGRPSADPMEGLVSARMRRLIDEARGIFDWVILDTPPLVLLPDAHLLASMVDGVIMVIRAESTPHHLIKRAVDAIGKERVLGVVLNRAHSASVTDEYNRYYYAAQTQALKEV
jgi:capsular exopolysaccharide synthesis family protein